MPADRHGAARFRVDDVALVRRTSPGYLAEPAGKAGGPVYAALL
jgi:hypothetical protein